MVAEMNDTIWLRTLPFRLCSNLNPRLGFSLVKVYQISEEPVRFELKHHSLNLLMRFPHFPRGSIGGTPIGEAFQRVPRQRSIITFGSI